MCVVIRKGLADAFWEALFCDSAFYVVLIFKVAAAVLVGHCRDMAVFVIFVMGNALIGVHHVRQIVSLIAVLRPAPDLIRDLQDAPISALYLQHISKRCCDLVKPVFTVCKHKALPVWIVHRPQLSLSVIGAQRMVHDI